MRPHKLNKVLLNVARLNVVNLNYIGERTKGRSPVVDDGYLHFKDPEVLRVLLANGVDKDGDGGITEEEAAAVTNIGTWFKGNTTIETFDEFEKFTCVTTLSSTVNSTSYSAFYNCSSLRNITIPRSIISIGYYTFRNCSSLSSITFEDVSTISTLHGGCFLDSGFSDEVYFPNLVTLDGACFIGSAITKVKSLGKITTLPGLDSGYGSASFDYCRSLTYVELPETLETINNFAFGRYTLIETIIFNSTIPPTLKSGSFNGVTMSNVTIYVPDASVTAYKEASGWVDYADRIKPLSEYE